MDTADGPVKPSFVTKFAIGIAPLHFKGGLAGYETTKRLSQTG